MCSSAAEVFFQLLVTSLRSQKFAKIEKYITMFGLFVGFSCSSVRGDTLAATAPLGPAVSTTCDDVLPILSKRVRFSSHSTGSDVNSRNLFRTAFGDNGALLNLWKHGRPSQLFDALNRNNDRNSLTDFGRELLGVFRNRTVYDLGSGHPSQANIVRMLAELFGAHGYEGIDRHVKNETLQNEFSDNDFRSRYTQNDMLLYLDNFKRTSASVFFMSGIEPLDKESLDTQKYQDLVMQKLVLSTQSGDFLVLGPFTIGFKMCDEFELVRDWNEHRIYRRR